MTLINRATGRPGRALYMGWDQSECPLLLLTIYTLLTAFPSTLQVRDSASISRSNVILEVQEGAVFHHKTVTFCVTSCWFHSLLVNRVNDAVRDIAPSS